MKIKSLDVLLLFALFLIVGSGFAYTWQQTNPSYTYGSIGMSVDGRIICAITSTTRPIFSTDSGNTWVVSTNTQHGGVVYLETAALSADGSRIYAALSDPPVYQQFAIWVSTNHGSDWAPTFPATKTPTNQYVACSADGTKVVAAMSYSGILYSTNGGVNCYTSSVAPANWTSIASSADGRRLVAAASGGSIYLSEDFGANWSPTNLPPETWNSVCMSADGSWMGATSGTHSYISSNSGVTWLTNSFFGRRIACSANGSNWLIASSQIEVSVDGGQSWQANLAPAQWNGGVISADGNQIVVVGLSQGTWVGRLTPAPQMNVEWKNTDVAVSWLLPSTNFVLQQMADISNPVWTAVPTNPVLNFTNLQEEVSVPANGSNAFFRLIAQ